MGSERALKLPASSVVIERAAPVSRSFTVMATPRTPAPEGSATLPEMAAVTWAKANGEVANRVSRANAGSIRGRVHEILHETTRRGCKDSLLSGVIEQRLLRVPALGGKPMRDISE